MVYHEVGHHKLGHLKQDKELYGLEGGEANALRNDATSSDHHDDKKSLNDYQRMEMEADIYSVQRIIDEFGDISAETAPFFEVALGHMELASLLVVALVIVKECLAPENLSFEDMDENIYLPKYLRLVMNLSTMILDADSTLMNEFKEVLMMVPRTREIIESEIGVISMDDSSKLREGLTEYLKSIVVFSEQTYAEIFLGTIDAMAFWEDFKAAKWWKRS